MGKQQQHIRTFWEGKSVCLGSVCVVAACAFSGVECVGWAAQVASSLERRDTERSELTQQASVYCFLQLTVGNQTDISFTFWCIKPPRAVAWVNTRSGLLPLPWKHLWQFSLICMLCYHKGSQKVELWFFGGVGGGGDSTWMWGLVEVSNFLLLSHSCSHHLAVSRLTLLTLRVFSLVCRWGGGCTVGVWVHKADRGFDKATGPASRQCFIKSVDLWLGFFFSCLFLALQDRHK